MVSASRSLVWTLTYEPVLTAGNLPWVIYERKVESVP